MSEYNVFYLPYRLNRKVNYTFLLCLYGIAKRETKDAGAKSIIEYSTLNDLQQQIIDRFNHKFSISTLCNILNNDVEYKEFFVVSPKEKKIRLNNNFVGVKGVSFVRISPKIYNYLITEDDNYLSMYVIYLLWACGIGKGQTDITAEQFMITAGYKTTSTSQKGKLCGYNKSLESLGILKIKRISIDGKRRNIYSFLLG